MSIQGFINDCLNSAVKIGVDYNKVLDFSDESIKSASEILDRYHDRYLNPEKDNSFIKEKANMFAHIFGVYVGEVLRRNHAQNCAWQNTEHGVAIVANEKNHVYPVSKAYKQIVDGKEAGDDIESFFRIAIMILQGKFKAQDRVP